MEWIVGGCHARHAVYMWLESDKTENCTTRGMGYFLNREDPGCWEAPHPPPRMASATDSLYWYWEVCFTFWEHTHAYTHPILREEIGNEAPLGMGTLSLVPEDWGIREWVKLLLLLLCAYKTKFSDCLPLFFLAAYSLSGAEFVGLKDQPDMWFLQSCFSLPFPSDSQSALFLHSFPVFLLYVTPGLLSVLSLLVGLHQAPSSLKLSLTTLVVADINYTSHLGFIRPHQLFIKQRGGACGG